MEGYTPKDKRKKILLLCDDIRMTSGISTIAREIVIGTAHKFNWVNVGGAINHPDQGKRFDLNEDTNKRAGISDSSVVLYPISGYGNGVILRQLIHIEQPDAIMFFTDPRYWVWLFQMEHEVRKKIPMIYLNIWDDLPYPMYNKSFYESCDTLFAISKQTENINRVVLGDKIGNKIIKYIPHGINEKIFFPITKDMPHYMALEEFRNQLFGEKRYDYVMLYNARNIRRKSIPDLMLAWKIFIDSLTEDKAEKCAFVLHTQPIDENGTDLFAVKDMLFGNNKKYNVIFHNKMSPAEEMNLLYNAVDVTALISSNEGWGLSLTESMMCGKPIIANVTGGMQDQMKFMDDKGKWIEFNEKFSSNHKGKYKLHGPWAFPVFPSNISLIGSVPTPYIYDDRVSAEDIAAQIYNVYDKKLNCAPCYEMACKEAYNWVNSDESMMNATNMCNNIVNGIEETFNRFQPREKFSLSNIKLKDQPKHYVKHVMAENY